MAHMILIIALSLCVGALCEQGGAVSGEYLQPHNQARAEVGVGRLKWSEALANATRRLVRYQRKREECRFADLRSGKYGANQLWGRGLTITPRLAVDNWVKEKDFYHRTNNTCAAGHTCGVYKQVVWRKSLEVGCAQATCAQDRSSLTICFYYPPGNIVGQRPY